MLTAAGGWVAQRAAELEALVDGVYRQRPAVDRVEINLEHLDRLDTVGAWLIERLRRAAADARLTAEIVGIDPRFKGLLDEVAISNKEPAPPPRHKNAPHDAPRHTGTGGAEIRQALTD